MTLVNIPNIIDVICFGYIASQKPVIIKMIYYDRLKHCHRRVFSCGQERPPLIRKKQDKSEAENLYKTTAVI